MIEIILSVCLLAEPGRCKEVPLTYIAENTTPFQCMMTAQQEVAKWSEGNPKWVVRRWSCRPARAVARI